MDEAQVRALVREALARHHGVAPERAAAMPPIREDAVAPVSSASHISIRQFQLVRPDGEIECLIEPTVTCNHCGHCQCFGH